MASSSADKIRNGAAIKRAKVKILFVVDKKRQWETNLWQSLKTTGLAQVSVLHDDSGAAVAAACRKLKPKVIVLVLSLLPGSLERVLSWRVKIPVIAVWGDMQSPEQLKLAQKLTPIVDFNIYTATSVALHGTKPKKAYIYFWVPKDKNYFFNPKIHRDIEVSFVGTLRPDRRKIIDYLINHKVKVMVKGGNLSTKEYSRILQRSKISLNFSRSGWLPIVTARAFEITACGAMLLEQAGPETAKLFVPMKEYVPYFSKQDLLKKIKYYLNHNQEREEIAFNGWERCCRDYSAKKFWQTVLERKTAAVSLFPLEDWRLRLSDYFFANKYFCLICYYLDRYAQSAN